MFVYSYTYLDGDFNMFYNVNEISYLSILNEVSNGQDSIKMSF